MATGSTWCKKGMERVKREALAVKLGTNKRFTDNRPAAQPVHNADVARAIAAARDAAKAEKRALRARTAS